MFELTHTADLSAWSSDPADARWQTFIQGLRRFVERNSSPAIGINPDITTPAAEELFRRPAVAVLPFANLSGEAEQVYFVDGITQDIVSALSYWRWFQ